MESFSQRKGFEPLKKKIQIDSIDDDLRNRLWNLVYIWYFHTYKNYRPDYESTFYVKELRSFDISIWINFLNKRFDELPPDFGEWLSLIKSYFFSYKWNKVYDLIEFITFCYKKNDNTNNKFISACNRILEKENSAYRFVGKKIAPMISKIEIAEIEESLEKTDKLKSVNTHIKTAIDFLSDRKNPDFRNSIKESISAVESICKLISDKEKATLPKALAVLKKRINIHPRLEQSFKNLYDYTSNGDGIRHALTADSNLKIEDARFMLVSCSAFTNYLIAKSEEAGIKLNK